MNIIINGLKAPLVKTLILITAFSCSTASYSSTQVITNIQGYTLIDNQLTQFKAIQFTDDKIDKIYTSNPPQFADSVRVIDGKNTTLLPGLIDAHGHVLGYGLSLMRAQLRGSQTELETVQKVQAFRKKNPTLSWIQGRGWNQVLWPSKQFPTSASIDKAFPNTPVWLRRIDGHAAWANSAAMKVASINRNTPSPSGGEIIRDANGYPTGVFIDNAQTLITKHIPELTEKEQAIILQKSMQALAALGLTGVHDAGIGSDTIKVYKQLAQQQKLPIRIYAMIDASDQQFDQLMEQGPYHDSSGKLDISSIKILADGALGSRGASLIDDYSDKHGHKGLLLYKDTELTRIIKQAMQNGFQVNTHAIGDKANQLVLDNYQAQIAATNSKSLRHRIEHAQVLQLEDIPRFKQLNVIASMQATHATSDKNMAEDRLGATRIQGAYAWRKLLNAGAVIAAGSDFPIESANPFFGLHASVTRQDHKNTPVKGWYPAENMTHAEALQSFTSSAAFAGHQEHLVGELKAGMKADFIMIDQHIFSVNRKRPLIYV